MTWFVVRQPKRGHTFQIPRLHQDDPQFGRGVCYPQDNVDVIDDWIEDKHSVFLCSDEASAKGLAVYLAANHTDVNFAVCEAKFQVSTKPSDPIWAAYSDKGLLPV